MKATIEIEMDNAAFEDGAATELGRILRVLAKKVEAGADYARLMDVNGNAVGEFNVMD